MKPLAKSGSIIADCIALAAFLLAAAIFAWSASATLGLRAQIAAAAVSAQSAADKAASLGLQEQFVSETTGARADLESLAIPNGGDAGFISEVESLGTAAGVNATISGVSAVAPVGSVNPGSLTFTASVTGSYAGCLRFLQLVETEHVALSLPSVSFAYDSGSGEWSGTMTIDALSFDSP
ncbi:MAG: hypothetical protein ACREGH_03725 [Minisyncoccia bacterium]